MGRGGARARARDRPAAARLDRLLGLPLVPRDGARVLRGPADRRADERALRVREGRPRGAPGRRRDLHGRAAGDDRPRRLAAERVPAPRRRAVLRRHLLPAAAAPGHAELAAGARGRRARVARAARRHRGLVADDPAAAGRRRRARAARRRGERGRPRGGGHDAAAFLRRRARRLGRAAEVPAGVDDRVPAAPRRARDGAAHAAPDGLGRDVRPGRRRLRPLQRRRPLDRPALREDALRQRAARPGVPARVAGHRRAAVRAHRRRRRWTGRCASCARRRAASRRRSTPTPRASRASSTSGRPSRCATRSPRTSRRPRCSTSGSCPAATSRA